jgi:hypothetical protein
MHLAYLTNLLEVCNHSALCHTNYSDGFDSLYWWGLRFYLGYFHVPIFNTLNIEELWGLTLYVKKFEEANGLLSYWLKCSLE